MQYETTCRRCPRSCSNRFNTGCFFEGKASSLFHDEQRFFLKKLLTTYMLVYIIKNVFDSGQQYMIP